VIWREQVASRNSEVYFLVSHDHGRTFASALNLSNDAGVSREAMVATSASGVYAIWRDNSSGVYDVYLRSSQDDGNTFAPTIDVSGDTGFSIISALDIPVVVASRHLVAVVWDASVGGRYEIFMSASQDGGSTFGIIVNLSNSPGTSNHPTAAISGNQVFTMWLGNSGLANNTDVFFQACSL